MPLRVRLRRMFQREISKPEISKISDKRAKRSHYGKQINPILSGEYIPRSSQSLQSYAIFFEKLHIFSSSPPAFRAHSVMASTCLGHCRLSESAIATEQNETRFLEVAVPEHADCYGMLDGANALYTMGKAAFLCATQHAHCAVVMAKADSIEFVRPIRIGCTIDVRARVVFQGQSSMTVIVEMMPDNPDAPESASISGRFMMVAVDENRIPMRIPSPEAHHQVVYS